MTNKQIILEEKSGTQTASTALQHRVGKRAVQRLLAQRRRDFSR